jgi:hypothetical protein
MTAWKVAQVAWNYIHAAALKSLEAPGISSTECLVGARDGGGEEQAIAPVLSVVTDVELEHNGHTPRMAVGDTSLS